MGEKFKDHFSAVASNYAAFRPEYPRALFAWLAEIVQNRARAWDCATGNGQAAVHLGEFFDEVIATDASAAQVANTRPHPKVRYRVAPAEKSGLPAQSCDLVTVAQSVHWFKLDDFYSEVRRVIRPGGVLALFCYAGIQFKNPAIQQLMDHFYHGIVGPYWPPERNLIEEHYQTIAFPFEELPAGSFAMEAAFDLDRLIGYLRTWSATQRFVRAKGFDPVEELQRSLEQVWPKGGIPQTNWPIYARVGRVN
jgi:ubiquinone/menaquinone biosynthesis C-methylase UbiE